MLNLFNKMVVQQKKLVLEKKIHFFSLIRFCLGAMILVFIICLITLDDALLYTILSVSSVVILLLFCIFTNPFYHQHSIYKNMELVYKKHENRRKLCYRGFPDGKEFIDYKDYKTLDLDLLGPRSLFQYLCSARSKEGRRKLAKQLTNPTPKEEKFRNCVMKLATSDESLQLEASIMAISNDAKECEHSDLLGIMDKKVHISPLGYGLMILSYAIMIVLLVILLVNQISPYYVLFFIPINYFIARMFVKNEVFEMQANKYVELLEAYQLLSKDVLNIQLEDPYYKEIQETLQKELPYIAKFKSLFDILSYRKNIVLSILGNGIFYMDYIIGAVFNFRCNHLNSIENSLNALTELECMLSLATIGMDQQNYCIPTEGSLFQIEEGYHPLVQNCVPNSFDLFRGIILTGSNMSGKTTFMRMLGINQTLANAGGIVCAKKFVTHKYTIVTSLRATDLLQEGISTFYAEVNRMKNIMQTAEQMDSLVLVDEIFKGTNAKDRIYAALEIIKKLNSFNVPFIITTHDFELCEAEGIDNFHFDETYEDDKILFDYLIKKGKCQKTNAIYLLQMAGVLKKGSDV